MTSVTVELIVFHYINSIQAKLTELKGFVAAKALHMTTNQGLSTSIKETQFGVPFQQQEAKPTRGRRLDHTRS